MLALGVFCSVFAMGTKFASTQTTGKAWVGIGYYMAENGYSNGAVAGAGVVGVLDSTLVGAAIGGPAGAVAGAIVGL